MAVNNTFKVPLKLWRKFSNRGKLVYNDMRYEMRDQSKVTHPGATPILAKHWDVIAHNAACLAAWGFDNMLIYD